MTTDKPETPAGSAPDTGAPDQAGDVEGKGFSGAEFFGRLNKDEKKKKQAKPKTAAEEQIEAAVARSALKGKRDQAKKKQFKMAAAGVGALLIAFSGYYLFKPYEGGMTFGICKVFLERSVRYPSHLILGSVEKFDTSVRIWYTQVDAFGEYRLEPIQCYYKPDDTQGYILEKITINRRELDTQVVEEFNKVLPIIREYPPDLTIPYPLSDSLEDLQIDSTMFRKPIL